MNETNKIKIPYTPKKIVIKHLSVDKSLVKLIDPEKADINNMGDLVNTFHCNNQVSMFKHSPP